MRFARYAARIGAGVFLVYAAACVALYFLQERLLFVPERLAADYSFAFPGKFEEHRIEVNGAQLSALWFHATPRANIAGSVTKGTVFYLHGNAGSLRSWGDVAPTFTQRGYDVFILDYRGYGKSSGTITSEPMLHDDVAAAYAYLRQRHPPQPIYIYGRSLGTGLAIELARRHAPQALLLEAPYLNLSWLAHEHYPWVPTALLRYRMPSDQRLPLVRAPVHFFHGADDATISPNWRTGRRASPSSTTRATTTCATRRLTIWR
jgi:alpha-beta hydrolase superfamily lysophospholipase